VDFTGYSDCGVQLAVELANSGGPGRRERLPDVASLQALLDARPHSSVRVTGPDDVAAVHRLRARLRRVFETEAEAEAVAILNDLLTEARALPQLTDHDGEPWHLHFTPPEAPLVDQLAAEAAMGLAVVVRDGGFARLRLCAQENCDDAFVDTSRNRSRRYCDPATCGNRAKARRKQRVGEAKFQQMLLEAMDLYKRVIKGDDWARVEFKEAMTTSDFQFLFGDIIDRQMLAAYAQLPVLWSDLARSGRVRDFRTVRRFTLDGGEAILDEVGEQSEYPAAALHDGVYEYRVRKHGRRVPLSWETLVNDDLDAFADIPRRLGNAARRSEERFATNLYATATGPASPFYSAGNANLTDEPLSIPGLQEAFRLFGEQVDTDGAPIFVDGAFLVVPPALEVPALNILNATEITSAVGSGPGNQTGAGADQLRVANWMRNKVTLRVNPWLPIIDQQTGSTAWYLFASPQAGRPAMEIGFLIGHETPELYQKHPNATRVGGGMVDPTDGDFDTDSVEWKVRHVFGGTLMDPKSSIASTGTGPGS
jgi:predicted RNA-binding Zn ribbon-like protein